MPVTISQDVLNRLVAEGRERGRLTTDDLSRALPIAAMAPDEIALVVVHLEEAGIPVEVDEALLGGRPSSPSLRPETGTFRLPEEPKTTPAEPAPLSRGTASGVAPGTAPPTAAPARWGTPLLVVAAIIVVIVLIWAFAR